MKTILYTSVFLLAVSLTTTAQTNVFPSTGAAGIGTTSPNTSSLLEIKSTAKGFLMPRMTVAQRNAIASPATGLMVYQTNSTPGFYYYNGSAWKAVTTKAGWSLTGNAGTTPGTNFIGTTDAQSLVFKVNGLRAGLIDYSTCCSGTRNTSFGQIALAAITTGADNTATGYGALYTNTTGNQNVAYGKYALFNNNADNNTAYGFNTMFFNTSGINNTAIGSIALQNNTSGSNNTATGYNSLASNIASNNTANGAYSLYLNTTGTNNTAMGYSALNINSTGNYNTATGNYSLAANTTGSSNTATGYLSLFSNQNGNDNVGYGISSLEESVQGYQNTALGNGALRSMYDGWNNTAIGFNAMRGNSNGTEHFTGSTAIGSYALYNITGANFNGPNYNTAVGYYSLYSNTFGDANAALGTNSLLNNVDGYSNSAVGINALYSNTSGYGNTTIGASALFGNITGDDNTCIGSGADVNSGGYNNSTAVGVGATITASNQIHIGSIGSFLGYDPVSIGGKVGWSTLSDGRVKKNIKENVPGLIFINKLKAVTYNLNLEAAEKIIRRSAIKDKDGKTIKPSEQQLANAKANAAIVYTGFVAQDVEKAAKSLSYDFSGVDAAKNDKDLYGLRYAEFVVPLVKAVQELSAKNDYLQKQIDDLKAMIVSNQSSANNQQSVVLASSSLEQNIPNPFTKNTTINYTLPQKFTTAQIAITDKNGKTIKTVNISGSGKGTVKVDASTLAWGAYQYSLIIDSKLIGTKQMLIAK